MIVPLEATAERVAEEVAEERPVSIAWRLRQEGLVRFALRLDWNVFGNEREPLYLSEWGVVGDGGELLHFGEREVGDILKRRDHFPTLRVGITNGRLSYAGDHVYLVETTEVNYRKLVRDGVIPETELIRMVGAGGLDKNDA